MTDCANQSGLISLKTRTKHSTEGQSDWQEFIEQRKAAALFGNELPPSKGQADIHCETQLRISRLTHKNFVSIHKSFGPRKLFRAEELNDLNLNSLEFPKRTGHL